MANFKSRSRNYSKMHSSIQDTKFSDLDEMDLSELLDFVTENNLDIPDIDDLNRKQIRVKIKSIISDYQKDSNNTKIEGMLKSMKKFRTKANSYRKGFSNRIITDISKISFNELDSMSFDEMVELVEAYNLDIDNAEELSPKKLRVSIKYFIADAKAEKKNLIRGSSSRNMKKYNVRAKSFSKILAEELINTVENTPTVNDKTMYYIERAIEDLNKNLKDVDFEFSDIITFYEPYLFSLAFTEQGEAILNVGKELTVSSDLSEVVLSRLNAIKLNENSKNIELKIIQIEDEEEGNVKEAKFRVLCRVTIPETLLVEGDVSANMNWKVAIRNADAISKNLIAIFK